MRFDRYGQYKPVGTKDWFHRRSQQFAEICPFSPEAANEDELSKWCFGEQQHRSKQLGYVLAAYVGHVMEGEFRETGSSGGMASWILTRLLRKGLVDAVVHVGARNRETDPCFFHYKISRNEEDILAGAKSRYYPVELSRVLEIIRSEPGRFAIVGIPCFIKAIRLLCRQDPILRERIIFTLGLFCGHMKSARLMESFAWQMGTSISELQCMDYRRKDPDRPARAYTAQFILKNGETKSRDWWNMADGDWGAGFFQNSACNFCDDVVAETADVSLGDAWIEPYASDGRGTNVVIVRSSQVHQLVDEGIQQGLLKLDSVDDTFISRTQEAGLRQRREGLAYRLCWRKKGIVPPKRVFPDSQTLSLRRKLVYRTRALITTWSHRVFWLACALRRPKLYIKWAYAMRAFYTGCTYFHGSWGRWLKQRGLK